MKISCICVDDAEGILSIMASRVTVVTVLLHKYILPFVGGTLITHMGGWVILKMSSQANNVYGRVWGECVCAFLRTYVIWYVHTAGEYICLFYDKS